MYIQIPQLRRGHAKPEMAEVLGARPFIPPVDEHPKETTAAAEVFRGVEPDSGADREIDMGELQETFRGYAVVAFVCAAIFLLSRVTMQLVARYREENVAPSRKLPADRKSVQKRTI